MEDKREFFFFFIKLFSVHNLNAIVKVFVYLRFIISSIEIHTK